MLMVTDLQACPTVGAEVNEKGNVVTRMAECFRRSTKIRDSFRLGERRIFEREALAHRS